MATGQTYDPNAPKVTLYRGSEVREVPGSFVAYLIGQTKSSTTGQYISNPYSLTAPGSTQTTQQNQTTPTSTQTPTTTPTTPTTQQEPQQTLSWNASGFSYDNTTGAFTNSPTFTLNGQTYRPQTAQEYYQLLQQVPSQLRNSSYSSTLSSVQKALNIANQYAQTQEKKSASADSSETIRQIVLEGIGGLGGQNAFTTSNFSTAFKAATGRAPTQEELGIFTSTRAELRQGTSADVRSAGDANDLITIRKDGETRTIARSQFSESYINAGWSYESDTGEQINPSDNTGTLQNQTFNHDLSSLSQYSSDFQSYINGIKDTVNFELNSTSIAQLAEQYGDMGAPGPLPETPARITDPANVQMQPEQPEMDLLGAKKLAYDAGDMELFNFLDSGQEMTADFAQRLADASGETDWAQYIGGVNGQPNPMYISPSRMAALKNLYTPYQIQQATMSNQYGTYWRPGVNIAEVSPVDPNVALNADANSIFDILTNGTSMADPTMSYKAKQAAQDGTQSTGTTSDWLLSQLKSANDVTAEGLYKELFNTPEIQEAQEEVNEAQTSIDELDQAMEELKSDIAREVEGEASSSYINALAAVRGGDILKLKRAEERRYNNAVNRYNSLIDNATQLMTVRQKDADTRYNRLFSALQLQLQQEQQAFSNELALTQVALSLPKDRMITLPNGTVIKGLDENDNLNIVQYTDTSGNTYVLGMDKGSGEEVYRTFIGKTKTVSSGSTSMMSLSKQVSELEAGMKLEQLQKINSGVWDLGYNDDGAGFYYDKAAYDKALAEDTWWTFKPDKEDYATVYVK